ncbi:MAG TPA: alpha/beta hydrolase-fold protein, partial [Pirellulales bacterium]
MVIARLAHRYSVGLAAACLFALYLSPALVRADKFTLTDGRILDGKSTELNTMKVEAGAADTEKLIVMIDNDLCRTYVPLKSLQHFDPSPADEQLELINIDQPVAQAGLRIGGVGNIIEITPWDADGLGRRTFSMASNNGRTDIIQGISKITPVWCRVDSLQASRIGTFLWDERIATSSVPRDVLSKIISRHIDPKKIDDRLKIVRLYLQGQRYKEAQAELKQVQQDFPDQAADFAKVDHDLKQLGARQVLDEIDLRRKAGQHQLAFNLLTRFPSDGVDGALLQKVRAKLDEYNEQNTQREDVVKQLTELVTKVNDSSLRGKLEPIVAEITSGLSMNTLDRMATYRRFADDPNTSPEGKLSLAISGWLIGAGEANDNLPLAMATVELRNLIRGYLPEANLPQRESILKKIQANEYGTPKLVAGIVANMLPHLDTPPPSLPGYFDLMVPGVKGEEDVHYCVQLPPEYDPHASYPCLFVLHGANTTPRQEIDWWCGDWARRGKQMNRTGQAARYGYIVIAPQWAQPHQAEFSGAASEHDAMLSALRDASRRFAIDSDRVFLAGQSVGGNAAWELGLSHPDLWAGAICIVATANKQVQQYAQNAEQLPLYFICGELDGDKMVKNGAEFDRYMSRNAAYDCTVVEYEGRGHEHFSDEILRL